MNPISVEDKLPEDGQRCLYWHSQHEVWYLGHFYVRDSPFGSFFIGPANGYIRDGTVTHWMPEPERPNSKHYFGIKDC